MYSTTVGYIALFCLANLVKPPKHNAPRGILLYTLHFTLFNLKLLENLHRTFDNILERHGPEHYHHPQDSPEHLLSALAASFGVVR